MGKDDLKKPADGASKSDEKNSGCRPLGQILAELGTTEEELNAFLKTAGKDPLSASGSGSPLPTAELGGPRALRIELGGGGRIAAVEAGTALDLKVTVLDSRGDPVKVIETDVVLSSNGKLDGGTVTLAAGAFKTGVHGAASVRFTEAGSGVALSAHCGDVSTTCASFAVLPAITKVKGTVERIVNQNAIVDKTKKARGVLSAPPQNVGSEALASMRSKRPVTGLNAAGKPSAAALAVGASSQGDKGTNCLCCTLGAITGKATTQLVHDMMREKLEPEVRKSLDESWNAKDKGLVDAEVQSQLEALIQDYGTMQDEQIWWRVESLKNLKTNVAETPPEEDDLGDAQLQGTRGLLVAEAKNRNKTAGQGGIRYKVVQDGLADTDPLKSKTYKLAGELQAQMGKYPDGTQFQVFVFGPSMKHWVYAEKYNGKVVMEDYQKARPESKMPKAAASAATGYTDNDVPHHPLEKEEPNVFVQGYFLAICPESFDSNQAWAGNSDWPQVTM